MMEELLEILKEINADVNYETCDNLVAGGYLTSFDIVMLISEIDQNMEIGIPAHEILPENFNSVQSIYELIKRLEEE